MKTIEIPRMDNNSDKGMVFWAVKHFEKIHQGQMICSIETLKNIEEINATQSGILYILPKYRNKKEVDFNIPIAFIFDKKSDIKKYEKKQVKDTSSVKVTNAAKEYALQHNVDLSKIKSKGIISKEDIMKFLGKKEPDEILEIGQLPEKIRRVIVLPAGLGAMQVADILLKDSSVQIVGFLEDDKSKHGKEIFGVKIIGEISRLEELYKKKVFDAAIIAISTNNALRKKFYEMCKKAKIPLINAIDPSVKISKGVSFGEGNVICGNSYIGSCTKIGNNNFISSNAVIEHHNVWGNHITTGPNVSTSGVCIVEDSVKFGMYIGLQPHVSIGDNSTISSGLVITQNIPSNAIVKKKKDYTIMEKDIIKKI